MQFFLCRKYVSNRYFAKSVFFYCLGAGIFMLGYFMGVLQSAGWCSERLEETQNLHSAEIVAQSKLSAFLIVIIFSSPLNHERRQTIRKTWLLTKKGLSIRHFFAIGSASLNSKETDFLYDEDEEYGDMLILDSVSDTFWNLSRKLRVVLQWLDKNAEFTFLLKVDDDSFVRLDELHSEMSNQLKERFYWGFFDGQARVKRSGKWSEKGWFLCDRYLPYAKGGGYVITSDLVHKLALAADYLSLYHNEDVALGTWLSPFEIKRFHDPRFDTEYISRGCFNSYLVTHKQSSQMMLTMYETLYQTGYICSSEYRERKSYQYNWNVPPSMCCVRNDSGIP